MRAHWSRLALVVALIAPPCFAAGASSQGTAGGEGAYVVTSVAGDAWLKHLGLTRQTSAMGRSGDVGALPRSAATPRWGESSIAESLDKPFTLTGADLYRIDCQACHNVEGIGTPPEIRSLIDAVRATSPDAIRAQMSKRGMTLDAATIRQMTAQADTALRERLKKGGEKMPSFAHLEGREVEALFEYLKVLAGLPGAPGPPVRVSESVVRTGEHLVKGTCFVCHDATGPGREALTTAPGLIPSLASIPRQSSIADVVNKVRHGAPSPALVGARGEMPVLSYLTEQEVEAAYIYLTAYPPRP